MLRISFSIKTHKTLKITILYLKKKYLLLSQMEKYIKTSENQDFNDFLLETLA